MLTPWEQVTWCLLVAGLLIGGAYVEWHYILVVLSIFRAGIVLETMRKAIKDK